MKSIIELLELSDWKKQDVILTELHRDWAINITSREWRKAVEKWNKSFANGEVNYYITHSNAKGFKATDSYQEAKIGRNDYLKRAYNMINKARSCDKAFGHLYNYQIDFEKGEIK